MIKTISTLFFSLAFIMAHAQVKDSVTTGPQNANDVYYSFKNGVVTSVPNNNWDLAFEIGGFSASILANHVKGITVYQTPYAAGQWTSMDTTQIANWPTLYNSSEKWSLGAFNRHTDGNFDLGWGVYNPGTHIIQGDSIYVLKFADGSYKKITFINLNAGVYNFKYSKLDGTGEKTISVDKANYKTKNFAYFTFAGDAIVDREPATDSWDLVFTKYTVFIPTPYNVGGVWTNKGATTAEAKVPTTYTDYSQFIFSPINSEIGYDWKTYNQPLNRYDITDNLVYFVTTVGGGVYKIVFTGYKGGASGTYYFNKQGLTVGISKIVDLKISVFPNPVMSELSITMSSGNKLKGYTICDATGKLIAKGSNNKINTSQFAEGIYYLIADTDLGSQPVKFIKTTR